MSHKMLDSVGCVGYNEHVDHSERTGALLSHGQLPKWPNGADCKSAVCRLRGFESLTAHPKAYVLGGCQEWSIGTDSK